MIITCPCGDKKFNVDASLIPQEGRALQCGFCDHKWFFKRTEELIEKCPFITIDLKGTNPYKLFLESIGKYKMEELKKIATELDISLKESGKNKVKQVLYNEINNYKLTNLILNPVKQLYVSYVKTAILRQAQ